ncbi:MaoC family dehydratase [Tessaracoccus caeni]|uniref:MaoC family dehydratase n=1 Tax=Tessaracoccus caeni TaxID=3031239 RepID=UPI0023DAE695|nr:MaoC/PaaZ C-terminal domain-containing protein [Tessaracoccus caeni]MDF1487138.1 MaoC/PaaZ C-terminal domain-containing protein [Tessaracoccus caeni]
MTDVRTYAEAPSVNKLFVKATLGGKGSARPGDFPDRAALIDDHRLDVEPYVRYARVTGFAVRDVVPPTWLHVLTFPLQMALMAEADFPFGLAGLVHVRNDMELLRPARIGQKVRLMARAENPQPHAKGVIFDMVGTVHIDDHLAWRGVSQYLARGAKLPGEPPTAVRETAPEAPDAQQWRLPPDLGRQYAAVSGDANPIHLSPVTARLFGFPRPIIHGMWTHARALAAFDGHLPEAYRVGVQFTKPIFLPGKVRFAQAREDGITRFVVRGKENKPHLIGRISAL